MGSTANEKGTKKRWRIGMRNKSKVKETTIDDDDLTGAPTPESSYSSFDVDSNGSDEEPRVIDIPPAMSEVDESSVDSNDDDLYLESGNDLKGIEEFTKAPQPMSDYSDDEEKSSHSSSIRQERSSTDQQGNDEQIDTSFNSDSSFEDDMNRHRMGRRNSPHFSHGLAKISEDSAEILPSAKNNVNIDDAIVPVKNQVDPIVPTHQQAEEEEIQIDPDDEEIDLPSHKELSKTLCKIVATEHYSGRESLVALEKLSKWAHTQDSNLLKHFLTYGGVVKVIDFLDEEIENTGYKDSENKDEFLMEAIQKAADVICNVCFVGKQGINEDIAIVNATVVVKYGGIDTLLQASNAINQSVMKDDPLALKAAEGIWNAIMNVYCNAEAAVTKHISMMVMDASIETMSAIGAVDHPIATETLANVFNSLYRITYHDFVTKEDFQERDLLTHCLNVFKRDVTPSDGDEELLEEAISFLYGCHEKALFEKGSDYESVLPLCVMGLREFAQDNQNIREWASKLLDGACSNIENKESIMMAEGAIEALAPFLTFKDVDADDKEFLRNLIRKILLPV